MQRYRKYWRTKTTVFQFEYRRKSESAPVLHNNWILTTKTEIINHTFESNQQLPKGALALWSRESGIDLYLMAKHRFIILIVAARRMKRDGKRKCFDELTCVSLEQHYLRVPQLHRKQWITHNGNFSKTDWSCMNFDNRCEKCIGRNACASESVNHI